MPIVLLSINSMMKVSVLPESPQESLPTHAVCPQSEPSGCFRKNIGQPSVRYQPVVRDSVVYPRLERPLGKFLRRNPQTRSSYIIVPQSIRTRYSDLGTLGGIPDVFGLREAKDLRVAPRTTLSELLKRPVRSRRTMRERGQERSKSVQEWPKRRLKAPKSAPRGQLRPSKAKKNLHIG